MIQNLLKVVEDYIGCDDQPLTIGMFKAILTDALKQQEESLNFSAIGQHITEPEQLDIDSYLLGDVPKDDEVEPSIKPEDMKAGEWYVVIAATKWLIKFNFIEDDTIIVFENVILTDGSYYNSKRFCLLKAVKSIRKATQQEVLKYFPNEKFN